MSGPNVSGAPIHRSPPGDKDCSVLHGRKWMSLGVTCVYGGVSWLRLVSQREREARWKLGGSTYSVCASCACGYLWLEGWGIRYLTYPLYALSVQNIITVSAPFTASWHPQVLVAIGHGIAWGKPSQTVSRMSGFGSEGTHVNETQLRKFATSR